MDTHEIQIGTRQIKYLALALWALVVCIAVSAYIASASPTDGEAVIAKVNPQQDILSSSITATNCGAWTVVSTPLTGTLRGIAARTANDIWAVGTQNGALHWDGTQWSTVPITGGGGLYSVEPIATNDVWAVGWGGFNYNLITHWNGTQWSSVSSPYRPWHYHFLYDVKAVSANDVWAVGYSCICDGTEDTRYTLILHWNGATWTMVPSPEGALQGMAVLGASDIWAVGWKCIYSFTCSYQKESLIIHWNGSTWSVVPRPDIGYNSELHGISAVGPNDIWAVGSYNTTGEPTQTLTMHWNGIDWSVIPSPNVGSRRSDLFGVAAIASNDVWAVGRSGYDPNSDYQTLAMHWNGSTWTIIPSSDPSPISSLYAVAAVVSNEVWAVGDYRSDGQFQSLIERYTFPLFSDVPSDNTFYSSVQCLVCRGIISGYADGTFRPNNEVTRGQLSKIVSNSAAFTEDPGEQRFEDVPPTHTFYEWIQRLAARGYIGGYECGGVGEPCISGMPYFRPDANATRGQISKIVSNAAGYIDPPTTQTFEDVPPTHTFYEWIQRLASRGIMSGYPCGGTGEPCVTGKPYFRPQNNATRGQTSKIVANTFFPECQAP